MNFRTLCLSACMLWSAGLGLAADVLPGTLDEAHGQLEARLPKESLAAIDRMQSEMEMGRFGVKLSADIRTRWLRPASALSNHMKGLGFTHSEDMADVVLATLWCRRHDQDLRLKERVHYYAAWWSAMGNDAEAPASAPPKDVAAPVKVGSEGVMSGIGATSVRGGRGR